MIKNLSAILLTVLTLGLFASTGYCTDPCQSTNFNKLSVPIDVGVGQFQLVAASTNPIRVCGYAISSSGGGTYQFGYASSCSSTLTNLTGAMFMGSNITPLSYSGPGAIFTTIPASNALCILTSASTSGVLTYVSTP